MMRFDVHCLRMRSNAGNDKLLSGRIEKRGSALGSARSAIHRLPLNGSTCHFFSFVGTGLGKRAPSVVKKYYQKKVYLVPLLG